MAVLRRRLRHQLRDQPDRSSALELLCRWLAHDLRLAGVTITVMVDDGVHGFAAASDESVRAIDAVQFDVGEGPSRESFSTGVPVLLPALGDADGIDGRWPGFVSETRARGIEAVYAFPLLVGTARLGVLTCYRTRAHVLRTAERAVITSYAGLSTQIVLEEGAVDLRGPQRFPDAGSTAPRVQIRTEVYQAQGMVKVDLGVSLDEALVRLRATAFAEGTPLNDLARDVVAGRRVIEPPESGGPHP